MRFMIIVKATEESEAGAMSEEEMIAAMADYHEELEKAGALVDAAGLQPSSKGWRIEYSGDGRSVTDTERGTSTSMRSRERGRA